MRATVAKLSHLARILYEPRSKLPALAASSEPQVASFVSKQDLPLATCHLGLTNKQYNLIFSQSTLHHHFRLYLAVMKIIEGSLPEENSWRVLVPLTPGESPRHTWELGLALAHANAGELITAVIIPDATEQQIIRARKAIETGEARTPADPAAIAERVRRFIYEE